MPSASAAAIAAFISAAASSGVGRAAADVVSTGSSSAIGANPSLVMVAHIVCDEIHYFHSDVLMQTGARHRLNHVDAMP
jgi:hypothetical protein